MESPHDLYMAVGASCISDVFCSCRAGNVIECGFNWNRHFLKKIIMEESDHKFSNLCRELHFYDLQKGHDALYNALQEDCYWQNKKDLKQEKEWLTARDKKTQKDRKKLKKKSKCKKRARKKKTLKDLEELEEKLKRLTAREEKKRKDLEKLERKTKRSIGEAKTRKDREEFEEIIKWYTAMKEKEREDREELEEIRKRLTAREEKERERKELETLFWFICQITRLLMLFCIFIAANGQTKSRLKYRYEKASLLILWHCGDVERNPGPGPPTISDTSRDFCKKMISLLVIRYWECKEGKKLTQADYKKQPEEWEKDVWYGDPSTCTNKDRNAMFKGLYNICFVQKIAIPNDWLVLKDKYESCMGKQCDKTEKTKYAKDLQSWLHQRRAFEAVDQIFDRLPENSEQERNSIVGHLFERLKHYLPDLNSLIFQSRKSEKELVLSHGYSTGGQSSYAEPSVDGSVLSEINTTMLNHPSHFTAKPLPDENESGKAPDSAVQADQFYDYQGCSKDLFGDNASSFVDYPTAYTEENAWSKNKACKRKAESDDDLDTTPTRSKMQKGSTELDFLQSTDLSIECHYGPHSTGRVGNAVTPYTTTETEEETNDCTDTTLEDLMDIIQPEIQENTTRPEDISPSDLDTGIQDDIPEDIAELTSYYF